MLRRALRQAWLSRKIGSIVFARCASSEGELLVRALIFFGAREKPHPCGTRKDGAPEVQKPGLSPWIFPHLLLTLLAHYDVRAAILLIASLIRGGAERTLFAVTDCVHAVRRNSQ